MKIVFDKKSEKAREMMKEVKKHALLPDDYVLVFGGDGTMLKAAHQYNFDPVFFGFNFGNRGSLMNDVDSSLFDKLRDKAFEAHQFPLLEVETDTGWKGLALEVYFNRIGPKTCKTEVFVNNAQITERLAGDGIDITTALASGGYFVNLGGSAVYPKLPVICFAPIVRNTPFQIMPMIFPDSSVFEVTLLSPANEVKGWCDGSIKLPRFQKIFVRKAEKTLKLVFWKEEDFNKRLVEKIMKVPETKK